MSKLVTTTKFYTLSDVVVGDGRKQVCTLQEFVDEAEARKSAERAVEREGRRFVSVVKLVATYAQSFKVLEAGE